MDVWQSHVMHEITDAMHDENRLLAITELMWSMEQGGLVPNRVADEVFTHIQNVNTGG